MLGHTHGTNTEHDFPVQGVQKGIAPPDSDMQELPDFTGEFTIANALGDSPGADTAREEFEAKTAAYLTQGGKAPHKKYHRKKAYQVLVVLNHQLRTLTGQGLEAFLPQPGTDPLTWRTLSVAPDQESCNVTAVSYMLHLGLAVDATWDVSHATWNDCKRAIKDAGDFPFVLLLMACFSMRHGPWGQGMRADQLRRCIAEYRTMMTPKCALFQRLLPYFAKEQGECHRLHFCDFCETNRTDIKRKTKIGHERGSCGADLDETRCKLVKRTTNVFLQVPGIRVRCLGFNKLEGCWTRAGSGRLGTSSPPTTIGRSLARNRP